MRKLRISTFKHARDNQAQEHGITFADFCNEDLQNPQILDEEPTLDGASDVKLTAAAWSSALFKDGYRSNDTVVTASILVFDLDGRDKLGVNVDDHIQAVEALGHAYCLHSTTRSGFCEEGKAKLRLLLPLGRDVEPNEYVKLWDEIAAKLPEPPDQTRRHPGGIFFAPIVFAAHQDRYVFRADLSKPWLLSSFFTKSLEAQPEDYWLAQIRTASEKHHALNKACFALAAERTRRGISLAGLAALCEQALSENTVSAPVESWSAARRTIARAIEDGKDAAENEPIFDPLKATKTAALPQLRRTAEARLDAAAKRVKRGGSVQEAAFEVGRFVPHALDETVARETLEKAWKACKDTALSVSEAATALETGLGAGRAKPVGLFEAWKGELIPTSDGTGFAPTQTNVRLLLEHHPDLHELVYFDVRRGLPMYRTRPPWVPESDKTPYPCEILDWHERLLEPWVCKELGAQGINSGQTFRALLQLAVEEVDPLLEYFQGLPTATGTELLERVLIEAAGAEDSPYVRNVTKWWFASVYGRQVNPGEKADHAIVLSGPQGAGKSSFFEALFPEKLMQDCFTSSITKWEDKDCVISLSKYAIVELPELAHMTARSVEAVKAFMTERSAARRPAYHRIDKVFLRRAVFAGTTNADHDFLVDDSGGRRFWPVKVGERINLAWVRESRDRIWAEARWQYEVARRWWPETAEERAMCGEVQDTVSAKTNLYDILGAKLTKPAASADWRATVGSMGDGDEQPLLEPEQGKLGEVVKYVTTQQAALLAKVDILDPHKALLVKRTLIQLKWKERRTRINGERLRRWYPPDK